jgi:Tol biopolymer transport system component
MAGEPYLKWLALEWVTSGPIPRVNPYFRWLAFEGMTKPNLFLTVQTSAGVAISGVSVTFADQTGNPTYNLSGTTDAAGLVATYLYDNHTYLVTLSKAGYRTRSVTYVMDRRREEIEVLTPAERRSRIRGHGL